MPSRPGDAGGGVAEEVGAAPRRIGHAHLRTEDGDAALPLPVEAKGGSQAAPRLRVPQLGDRGLGAFQEGGLRAVRRSVRAGCPAGGDRAESKSGEKDVAAHDGVGAGLGAGPYCG